MKGRGVGILTLTFGYQELLSNYQQQEEEGKDILLMQLLL